jgi:hypothetical protein
MTGVRDHIEWFREICQEHVTGSVSYLVDQGEVVSECVCELVQSLAQ